MQRKIHSPFPSLKEALQFNVMLALRNSLPLEKTILLGVDQLLLKFWEEASLVSLPVAFWSLRAQQELLQIYMCDATRV